jgi:hypothetical protein
MWVFGIILCVGTVGFIGTLILTHDFVHNPEDELPPEMLIMSVFGLMLAVSSFVLVGLFLTMKNKL